MAYTTKYQADYVSGTRARTILLQEKDYSGPVIELCCSISTPRVETGASDSIFGDPIVTSLFRMEFVFEENYDLTDFVKEARAYKVVVLEGGQQIWSGWLQPYDTSRNYQKPRYFVTMVASCGLNSLAKKSYEPPGFNDALRRPTYWELMKQCLATIGIERTIRVSLHTYQNAYPARPNPLTSVKIDILRYYPNNEWMDCRTILLDILEKFNAEIFLHNDMWVIRGKVDHALGATGYIEYPAGGGQTIVGSWPGLIKPVNGTAALTLQGGQVSLQSAIRKYTANVDLGGLNNTSLNGGLQLWDNDGPVGWHMGIGPGGWIKKETGIQGNPYALYVNGFAPKPYENKKKKGIWPFRKTVSVPIQPTQYLSPPPIPIKITDEKITVGFEYHTDADSSGFFYSIHVEQRAQPYNKKYPEVLWYNPDSPASLDGKGPLISDEFTMFIAPPHPLINEKGVVQAKARVSVFLSVKELNRNPWYTGETLLYDKIIIRFYKSVDAGKSGDGYTVYLIDSSVESDTIPADGDSRYTVVLEQDASEIEEGETINLISGDYSQGYIGTTFYDEDLTGKWARRDAAENISIYRAMLLDRLMITSDPRHVIEADIKILDSDDIFYFNYLQFVDRGDKLYKIVRYSFEEYRRIAQVTAIEINVNALANVKQKTYTEARGLLDAEGESDGIYPGGGTPSGRLGAEEDLAIIDTEAQLANGRLGIFEEVPILYYVYQEKSTETVNLFDFLSEAYLEDEQGEDIDLPHDPLEFVLSVVSKPAWVSEVFIDGLTISVTAKPTVLGDFVLELAVVDDTFGIVPNVKVPIKVLPKTKVDFTLLETSASEPVVLGELPGTYPLPARWDDSFKISGPHDWWQSTIVGGGPTGEAINLTTNQDVSFTNSGTYRMFLEENGIVSPAGLFRQFITTSLDKRIVSRQNITFVLGDEAFFNKAKFYLTKAGSDISQILPDGTSVFESPETGNVKAVVADTSHDKVVVQLTTRTETNLGSKTYNLSSPATGGNYFVYDADSNLPVGLYTALLTVYLAGEKVLYRFVDFEIKKKVPVAVGGALKLVKKNASRLDFTEVAVLPQTGGLYDLADFPNGYSVLSDAQTDEYDWEGHRDFIFKAGKWIEVDTELFTGQPPYIASSFPITESEYYIYGTKTSKDVKVHITPSTKKTEVTRKLGGASGEIVAIFKAEYAFGEAEDTTDAEEGGGGSDIADYVAGSGMSHVDEKFVRRFNVNVDGVGIETFESESPNDPDAAGLNHLRLKNKGVTFAKIQDIPTKTVIGRMAAGTGVSSAISIIDLLDLADDDNIPTGTAVKDYIDELITASLAKYMPLTNVTTGNTLPVYFGDVNSYNFTGVALLGAGAANAPNATPGMLIAGVSGSSVSQLVVTRSGDNSYYRGTNGGALGTWYQIASRAWVDLKEVNTGTGLLGGGAIATNLTLTFDTAWGDARYFVNAATGYAWTGVNVDAKPKFNLSGVDAPAGGGTAYHGIFMNHGSNTAYGSTIAFRNGVGFYRSVEAGVWGTWLQFADRDWVNAKQILGGNGMAAGSGGDLSANRTITLGTPSQITQSSTNSVTTNSHTHAIDKANLIAGTNVSLSASGTGVLLGNTNITINVTSVPWNTGVSGKPTSLAGFGIIDGVTIGDFNLGLGTKEDTFAKGNLVQGSNVTLSGTLTNRLVGSGNVTVSVDLSGYVPTSRTITINGTTYDLSANRSWTISAGISGSGSYTSVAVWGFSNALTGSSIMFDNGSQVTVTGGLVVSDFFGLPVRASDPGGGLVGSMYLSSASGKVRIQTSVGVWENFDYGL